MNTAVYYNEVEKMWVCEDDMFLTKANAIANAEYRLEGIGGTIHVQKRNGDFDKTITIEAPQESKRESDEVYMMTRTPEGYVIRSERTASLDTFIATMDALGAVYETTWDIWESADGSDYWPVNV